MEGTPVWNSESSLVVESPSASSSSNTAQEKGSLINVDPSSNSVEADQQHTNNEPLQYGGVDLPLPDFSSRLRDVLRFSPDHARMLEPHVPSPTTPYKAMTPKESIRVTLTYAQSLDGAIALAPGMQTALSGPESKAMTHHLRSRHDAILIGVGTMLVDNPSLNCRIEGAGGYGGENLEHQPIPVIIDPQCKWDFGWSKVFELAQKGKGRPPIIVHSAPMPRYRKIPLQKAGGVSMHIPRRSFDDHRISWNDIFARLRLEHDIKSVMVEGGGSIIEELLAPENFWMVDSVIVTIAPTWLGKGAVSAAPKDCVQGVHKVAVAKLKDVKWVPLGDDVVMCAKPDVKVPQK
ncbi:hypothetical protein EJ04DRAFT_510607 [Polyplosphaeria fusca]|uniref:2,5-diamino-6-ribosylamino-4(3H)-pyrimidinone 5'-phosphate reductase n=1 Tax=Polyplosphaeria fusca TaxID=682080 RepID=A0A9P4R5A7_9PLEO|nr:hypothetical protein EJ04DRAFT_510607 [Polyplosphaeria fusca]